MTSRDGGRQCRQKIRRGHKMESGVPIISPVPVFLMGGPLVPGHVAFPTRGEGQVKAPSRQDWNVRVAKRFPLGDGVYLEAAVDIFNFHNRGALERYDTQAVQLFSPNYLRFASAPSNRPVAFTSPRDSSSSLLESRAPRGRGSGPSKEQDVKDVLEEETSRGISRCCNLAFPCSKNAWLAYAFR